MNKRTKQEIIKEAVEIILQHAAPSRIYLYGSLISGEITKASDIDIAYVDEKFKEHYLLEEEIEKIPTLLKVDVRNLAFTEDRIIFLRQSGCGYC